MKNEIVINGKQNFMGKDIPIVEGGFGENCKVILVKTIAEIHDMKVKEVNKLINNNIDEFEFGVDILDLKTGDYKEPVLEGGILTKSEYGNSNNVYILSEQGYMLLVGFMKTDKAKEIRKKLRREYFSMREIINSDEQLKAKLLLSIYDGGEKAVVASKQLSELEVKRATAPLLEKIKNDKPLTDFAKHVTESSDTVDVGEFAKIVKQEHIDLGRNKLFTWFRENKYLLDSNVPYQRYIDNGYFKVIEVQKSTPYGVKIYMKTLITGKGQVYFVEKLRKEYCREAG